jgi:hypothetical protein
LIGIRPYSMMSPSSRILFGRINLGPSYTVWEGHRCIAEQYMDLSWNQKWRLKALRIQSILVLKHVRFYNTVRANIFSDGGSSGAKLVLPRCKKLLLQDMTETVYAPLLTRLTRHEKNTNKYDMPRLGF